MSVGQTYINSPHGRFRAYCDNPYSYGGRNKRRFKVHSHGKVIELVTQKKLTFDAILHFVRSWADKDAKIITPGKRTICLDKQKAKTPCYVYFVLNSTDRYIKIGVAKNVKRRLISLQTSNSAELVLLKSIKGFALARGLRPKREARLPRRGCSHKRSAYAQIVV